MGRRIQKPKKGERREERDIEELPMDQLFLKISSILFKRIKRGLKNAIEILVNAFRKGGKKTINGLKTVGEKLSRIFQRLRRKESGLKSGKSSSVQKEKGLPRKKIKDELREIQGNFSPPRPEITLFMFKSENFFSYSTSEVEEEQGNLYYSSLAAFNSVGRNIVRSLIGIWERGIWERDSTKNT